MTDDIRRDNGFARNESLEALLVELNAMLSRAEQGLALPSQPTLPVLLVVGPPRSGTTLVMQWLAATGSFSWPTNLLSRFYAAPYVGARIQQLLTDPQFNYRNELIADASPSGFESDLGKTRGLLQPNEFWYFWRRFFPLQWPEPLSQEQQVSADGAGFVAGLAAIECALGKPFAAKALLLQYNLTLLSALLPKAIFLHVRRNPVENAASLLRARERFWGDSEQWYSARPPGSESLLIRNKYEQVAGQVAYTHSSIERELSLLPNERHLRIDLEEFRSSTHPTWRAIVERCELLGHRLPSSHAAPRGFARQDSVISDDTASALTSAFDRVAMP
ncbi:sulfotransferase [Luteimonas sp. 50]|uniref:Sulfotransferase n=1 Tax=Cognatiluteimonas sedimenti TaxID=2927791 RepID=A0ABT0A3Z9_9GAMM|nr:sulfotransferase [Lysobacter sedimenti]MCJ0825707.1 sulfotransferase [Lysobacter sedimenti]